MDGSQQHHSHLHGSEIPAPRDWGSRAIRSEKFWERELQRTAHLDSYTYPSFPVVKKGVGDDRDTIRMVEDSVYYAMGPFS